MNRELFLALLCTGVGIVLILFGISVIELKILLAVTFGVLIILFVLSIFDIQMLSQSKLDPRISNSKKLLIFFILAIITSLIVVIGPKDPITISSERIYETFLSMNPIQLFELFSACFLITFAPGYLVVSCFLGDYNFDMFGKLGLSLAISYCVSNILGTVLITSALLSPINYIVALWMFIVIISYLKFRPFKRREHSSELSAGNRRGSISLNLFLKISILLIAVIVTSYYVVTVTGPLGGYTRWDVYEYFRIANDFATSGINISVQPYLGFPLFFYILSRIAYVPMLYAYVALQYYSVLVFLSIYLLIKTLFPKNVKAPYYALLIFLMGNINSIYFLFTIFTNPEVFMLYSGSTSKFEILRAYGAGGMLFTVYGHMFVLSLCIFGIIFGYYYLKKIGRSRLNLLLTALFAGISLYSHNLLEFGFLTVTLLLFSLFGRQLKDFLKLLVAIVAVSIALEPIYKFFLINYISFRISQLQVSYSALWIIPPVLIVLSIGIFLLIFRDSVNRRFHKEITWLKDNIRIGLRQIDSKFRRWLPKDKDTTIRIIALTAMSAGIVSLALSYFLGDLIIPNINVNRYTIMPLWFYIINLIVPLTIIVIVPSRVGDKNNCAMINELILALLLLSLLGILFPTIFWRNMWTHRFLMALEIPLILIAALRIGSFKVGSSNTESGRINILNFGKPAFIILMLSVACISYGHTLEIWSTHPIRTGVSPSMSEGVNWANNHIGIDATVLALNFEKISWGNWHQNTTYKTLCGLLARTTIVQFQSIDGLIGNLNELSADNVGAIFIYFELNQKFLIEFIKPYYDFLLVFNNSYVYIYQLIA